MRADGFQEEVLARLRDLKTGQRHNGVEHPQIPLIDPTANVLALVSAETKRQDDLRMAEFKRQDDLRKQAESFQARLLGERLSAEKEAKRAEAGRIDALLAANTNNVALALEKQGAQAQAQDKRIAALEQNQYQGVGATGQRGENRQQYQWLIGVAAGLAIAIILHFWK
jgi:hypothetical protein